MRTAIITFSTQGKMIGLKLKDNIPDSVLFVHESVPNGRRTKRFKKVSELIGNIFNKVENIIYIGPMGIAVRSICAHVRNKLSDPAVVVVDAGGRFAISVLSGHEGGANALAISVANILGAEPVISTTTEAIKTITVGIGCRKGTKAEVIVGAVKKALTLAGVTIDNVKWLATAEIKRNEAGLKKASQMLNLPLRIIPNWLM
ncbi:MAG: cobalamin biosynthesis protein, partial [Candidatus Nanoarchaeia archaeon]